MLSLWFFPPRGPACPTCRVGADTALAQIVRLVEAAQASDIVPLSPPALLTCC